jgi:hypothetical protein
VTSPECGQKENPRPRGRRGLRERGLTVVWGRIYRTGASATSGANPPTAAIAAAVIRRRRRPTKWIGAKLITRAYREKTRTYIAPHKMTAQKRKTGITRVQSRCAPKADIGELLKTARRNRRFLSPNEADGVCRLAGSGKIALWTKADSVTDFDQFTGIP